MDQLNDNSKFVNATNTFIGCPVVLRDKWNCLYHGIFHTLLPDFDVILECCHKIDPSNETLIFDRSIPDKSRVKSRFFEREDIVEMTAYQVDVEFATKSKQN